MVAVGLVEDAGDDVDAAEVVGEALEDGGHQVVRPECSGERGWDVRAGLAARWMPRGGPHRLHASAGGAVAGHYDPVTHTLTFEVRISDRRGPVVGGPVEMAVDYQHQTGEGPVKSRYMTTGDAEGVATGTVTLDRLIQRGKGSGHLTGVWLAAFHTERAVSMHGA